MKNFACILFVFVLAGFKSNLVAQDLVGLTHKQVLEYWQKTVPADQINDNEDLLVVNGTTFCSFQKKICVEFTTTIPAAELDKKRIDLNENRDLQYDEKTNSWINAAKKCSWKYTKVSETEYELSCKKL